MIKKRSVPLAVGVMATGLVPSIALAETYDINLSQLQADEQEIIAQAPEGLALVQESIETLDNDVVEAITVNSPSNPENVKRVESIVSEQQWEFLFPERHQNYTYLNFLKGVGKYPAFCGTYSDGRDSDAICRKSLATMFAHFTQETGGHNAYSENPQWRQGLVYLREIGWDENTPGGYGICDSGLWQGQAYPCGTFPDGSNKSYFGRGAKQLSYNYNYGPFSYSIYGNVEKLLNEPELVADTWLNLASAVFFYLYPQPPKPSMLHVMDGTWQPNQEDLNNGLVPGFGVTTQIINGGVECGGSSEHQQSLNRIEYYREFASYLGVDVPEDEVLGCASMKQFTEAGAGALQVYWEQDWSWTPDTPSGEVYKCQLVAYQGPFSAFIDGDYVKCVDNKFDVNIIDDSGPQPPVADAGSDVTLYSDNSNVTLDGSGSQNGSSESVTYQWTQVSPSAPTLTITNADQASASVVVPPVDSNVRFEFSLTVTNSDGVSDSDTMAINAQPMPGNFPPEVTLNAPESVTAGGVAQLSVSIDDVDDSSFNIVWNSAESIQLVVADDNLSASFTAPDVAEVTSATVTVEVTDSANNVVTESKTITLQPQGGAYPAWQLGHAYNEGDLVTEQGVNYECKKWPVTGWCGANEVYKPGEGLYWQEAWIQH